MTQIRPMRPVARKSRPRRGLAPKGGIHDPLEVFLRDIRDTPVLTADQEVSLGKTMREQRGALLATLARIPGLGLSLESQWNARLGAGLVPHRLSEIHDGSTANEALVTEAFASTQKELKRAFHSKSEAVRARASRKLVQLLIDFEPTMNVQLEWLEKIEEDLARPATARERWRLPAAELRSLVGLAAQYRDAYLEARATFVRHNLRFVVHMAKSARYLGVPFGDLIQEGNIGLIRAVEKFDERKGFRFSTYAAWWIDQAFRRLYQKDARMVRVPSRLLDLHRHLRVAESRLAARLERDPTEQELAIEMEISDQELAAVRRTVEPEASLDITTGDEMDRSWVDKLEDNSAANPIEDLDQNSCTERVKSLLGSLSSRERRIVSKRFGLGEREPQTLQSLADELGLSRERIRQIEKVALARIRGEAELQGLREYVQ